MSPKKSHKAWLAFIRKALAVPEAYSKEDLWEFRNIASLESPSLVRLIEDYLRLAENSETSVRARSRRESATKNAAQPHLFDLLRDKKFFPQNADLGEFASRVVPNMRSYRFDKMSRSDIAARVIEYLEQSGTRDKLELSMRDAFTQLSGSPPKAAERRSFLSKWEKIIKGIEF